MTSSHKSGGRRAFPDGQKGTLQDALARHRVLNGQAATVLDLGVILSVGNVAENEAVLVTHLRKMGRRGYAGGGAARYSQ